MIGIFAWMVIAESLIGGLFNAARPYLPYTAATALGGVPIGTASFGPGRAENVAALPFAAGPRCCWRSRWRARCWLIALPYGGMSAEEAAPSGGRAATYGGGRGGVGAGDMDDAWGTIDEIIEWLDGGSTLGPEITKLIRIMKLNEEAGEVTQAVIGTLGQTLARASPTLGRRPGRTVRRHRHRYGRARHAHPRRPRTFDGHLARVASRSLGTPSAAAATS